VRPIRAVIVKIFIVLITDFKTCEGIVRESSTCTENLGTTTVLSYLIFRIQPLDPLLYRSNLPLGSFESYAKAISSYQKSLLLMRS